MSDAVAQVCLRLSSGVFCAPKSKKQSVSCLKGHRHSMSFLGYFLDVVIPVCSSLFILLLIFVLFNFVKFKLLLIRIFSCRTVRICEKLIYYGLRNLVLLLRHFYVQLEIVIFLGAKTTWLTLRLRILARNGFYSNTLACSRRF